MFAAIASYVKHESSLRFWRENGCLLGFEFAIGRVTEF